jgi:flagellin-like protein
MASAPERTIGIWRGSKASLHFWVQTILTLSLYYWFIYLYNDITVTNERVTQRRGSFYRSSESTLTLDSITDVSVRISLLGELLHYGDIRVLTAGSRQSEIVFWHLENPNALRDVIFKLRSGSFQEAEQLAKNQAKGSSPIFGIVLLLIMVVILVAAAYLLVFARR